MPAKIKDDIKHKDFHHFEFWLPLFFGGHFCSLNFIFLAEKGANFTKMVRIANYTRNFQIDGGYWKCEAIHLIGRKILISYFSTNSLNLLTGKSIYFFLATSLNRSPGKKSLHFSRHWGPLILCNFSKSESWEIFPLISW